MNEINPLSKFPTPLISFICGEDTISVRGSFALQLGIISDLGIICSTIWGSCAGRDHLRARTEPVSAPLSLLLFAYQIEMLDVIRLTVHDIIKKFDVALYLHKFSNNKYRKIQSWRPLHQKTGKS